MCEKMVFLLTENFIFKSRNLRLEQKQMFEFSSISIFLGPIFAKTIEILKI